MTFGDFKIGEQYNRRRDLHDRFGGQRQGGISTPAAHPVIFLITGETGTQHGYTDGWDKSGAFHYYGEGQLRDMQWKGSNSALRDHSQTGRDLLLFQTLGKGRPLRFVGQFFCVGWHYAQAPDRQQNIRQAIVFELLQQGSSLSDDDPQVGANTLSVDSLAELRAKALAAVLPPSSGSPKERTRLYYQRSETVRAYVLRRAEGRCERCAANAPFETREHVPYLEPHHIRRLSDGGPDDPRFMAALCPNCHRRIHYGEGGQQLNDDLHDVISKKEAGLESVMKDT